jgi:photosystem II stability/assembly factor-like uncharacterized protein
VIVAVIAVLAAVAVARHTTQSGTLVAVAMQTPTQGYGLFIGEGSNGCTIRVGHTTDGGAHFGTLTVVGPEGCTVPGLAFAGGDGFVYGRRLFVTHDGGRHWSARPGNPIAVAARGSTVWSVQRACVTSGGCRLELVTSDDGGRTWSAPGAALRSAGDVSLVLTGSRAGYLLTGDHLYRSADGGRTFAGTRLGCAGETTALTAAPRGVLVAACAGEPGAGRQAKAVAISRDGGRTWSTHRPCGRSLTCRSPIVQGYLGSVAATSAGTFFLIGARSALLATRDGGASWRALAIGDVSGVPAEVQFVDARHGIVLGRTRDTGAIQIWHSADGGRTWTGVTPSA